MGEKGTIMLALAMVSMSIAFSIAVITWKSNVAGNMMVPSFNLRNQTMLSTQTSAPLRQSSSTYKSCIGRLESCEGSFEFNTGHIKSRTDAFHLPDETRDYFLHVTDEESKHGVLQCINQLNATALAEYDRNYRWGHGGGERFPAKIYEELLIYYHLFPQITRFVNPYFIELGGHEGVTESNTLALEFCANWNGLLVEGNSRIYTQLMDNRPQISKMLLAPSCKFDNGTVEFVAMANKKSTMSGLRGVVEGNREGTLFDSTHCGPLHLYLNVEGSENAVLETVDFDAVTIDIWEIESWNRMCHQDCPKRSPIVFFIMMHRISNIQSQHVNTSIHFIVCTVISSFLTQNGGSQIKFKLLLVSFFYYYYTYSIILVFDIKTRLERKKKASSFLGRNNQNKKNQIPKENYTKLGAVFHEIRNRNTYSQIETKN